MNISTVPVVPLVVAKKKVQKTPKKSKRVRKSKRAHKPKRSHKSKRAHKSKRKQRDHSLYTIQNQIDQFYKMTLDHLSTDQKGFLDISNNAIKFTGKISMEQLQEMPWMPELKDIKAKLPIASPVLLGPFTFTLAFSQKIKTEAVERRLTVQNGTLCLVKNQLLNLQV